jgi:hypothetical protein
MGFITPGSVPGLTAGGPQLNAAAEMAETSAGKPLFVMASHLDNAVAGAFEAPDRLWLLLSPDGDNFINFAVDGVFAEPHGYGVRDPSIVYWHEYFWILYGGWTNPLANQGYFLIKSKDLINWTAVTSWPSSNRRFASSPPELFVDPATDTVRIFSIGYVETVRNEEEEIECEINDGFVFTPTAPDLSTWDNGTRIHLPFPYDLYDGLLPAPGMQMSSGHDPFMLYGDGAYHAFWATDDATAFCYAVSPTLFGTDMGVAGIQSPGEGACIIKVADLYRWYTYAGNPSQTTGQTRYNVSTDGMATFGSSQSVVHCHEFMGHGTIIPVTDAALKTTILAAKAKWEAAPKSVSTLSYSGAANMVYYPLANRKTNLVVAAAGSGTYTASIQLAKTNAAANDLREFTVQQAATNPTIVFRNGPGDTDPAIATLAPSASLQYRAVVVQFDGSDWVLVSVK